MTVEENLISCTECGSSHLPTTICLQCYMVIREETNKIKEKMMMYNPYIGERQWRKWSPPWERTEKAAKTGEAVEQAQSEGITNV